MKILGVSGLYHDSAAALLIDGEIVSAAQEERFTRIKHDKALPEHAIAFCLRDNAIRAEDLDAVIYYDNPLLTLDRFLKSCAALGEKNETIIANQYEALFGEKMWIQKNLKELLSGFGKSKKLLVCEHHMSHAAYAFYSSPFEDAAILTMDGVGEWATTSLGIGEGEAITMLRQIDYPHSLGLLYSAFTYFCGFKVNSGEYKLMGLAPFGKPRYCDLIKRELIDIKEDGSYQLKTDAFTFMEGEAMTGEVFERIFGCKRRLPETEIESIYLDLAASVQKVTEEVVLGMARHLKSISGKSNLCLSGGVALNCVANGVLSRENVFDNVFIPPAAGDAGGSVGACLYAYHQYFRRKRKVKDLANLVFLGPGFSTEEEKESLDQLDAVYRIVNNTDELLAETAKALAGSKIVGFFNGRMEFGPRALGARSILADPRDEGMQSKLNLKIKYRESFRPFAPAVLAEHASSVFDMEGTSPYMLLVAPVREELRRACATHSESIMEWVNEARSAIPAVTHVDYSARVQTVCKKDNERFYRLMETFYRLTGCPLLVNTSFNVRGEPIVCTPQEAYECFMHTEMDMLVMDDLLLYKEEQPPFENRRMHALD